MKKVRAASKTQGWDAYARHHKNSPANPWILRVLEEISPGLEIPRVAVDLGCGTGGGALALQAHGFEVHGVDINRPALAFARKRVSEQNRRAKKAGLHLPAVKLHRRTLARFEIPRCGLLVAIRSLGFLKRPELLRLLNQLPRKVAPQGLVVLHFFGPRDDWALAGSVSAFSKKEILKILRGFRVLKIEESQFTGGTAAGARKNWHEVFVIARRLRA